MRANNSLVHFRPEFNLTPVIRTLKSTRLFADVPMEDLERIAAISVQKRLTKSEHLFRQGGDVHGFYIVQQGAIKEYSVNPAGKEQVLRVFRPPDSFAEETLFSGFGYPANACATERTSVLLVQKNEFICLLRRRPELAMGMFRSLNRHFCGLVDLLDDLTLKDVSTRLGNWLLKHCPAPESTEPCSIRLPATKRLLASELGTMAETFSRTLAKFRQDNLLVVHGDTVTLLCPVKLAQWLHHSAFPEEANMTHYRPVAQKSIAQLV
jgi:CRP/FNR family transcriptional regulator, dissimilatory nitrate respiration regulator